MSALARLPSELLLYIFSFLPPEAVIPLHSTSRRLRTLTRDDGTLWRSLTASASYSPFLPDPPELSWPPDRELDWYEEYKYRHGPLSVSWLSSAQDEITGLSVFGDKIAATLDDGSITLYNARGEIGRSKKGLLTPPSSRHRVQSAVARLSELGDGLTVDMRKNRIYVATAEGLIEVDLTTLQRVSTTAFPFAISTISQSSEPLVVGTTLTLHLHDSREAKPHASLFQPGPLAILRHPNELLYVAGRFPSILTYDLRNWSKLAGTMYSGGRLCTLAADGPDLVAGGEYNGRGTLEKYKLNTSGPRGDVGKLVVKNRQTAARSKVLSVCKQGARVVAADGDGVVSWFESDCRGLVRREVVDGGDATSGGLWARMCTEGEAVRKIDCFEGGLACWVGERVGFIGVGKRREIVQEAAAVESEHEREMRNQREVMRRLLERQADEVRFLGALSGIGG